VLSAQEKDTERLVAVLDRLGRMSVEDYYNPYRMFEWPDTLPTDELWMSRDLLSVYNTPFMDQLSEEQLIRLARWESVNFYSLNVHGIRELLIEVVNRIHLPGFEIPSDFFHHFVGEENEHMWFFAEFCKRYGGKMYHFPRLKSATKVPEGADVENFLVFARILIFEEMVDYYNSRMADDESLHDTIRAINRIHHKDESRHIAFGRELVSLLYARMKERRSAEELRAIGAYVQEYVTFSLHSFYSLEAYDDAGIEDPIAFRKTLTADPARVEAERQVARKPTAFFHKLGLFEKAAA
jgi:hypothetical protein